MNPSEIRTRPQSLGARLSGRVLRLGIIALIGLASSCGLASGEGRLVRPDPKDADTVVGSLSWEIQDTETKEILGHGEKVLHVRDVEILDKSDIVSSHFSKRIRLDDHFSLDMAEFPESTRGDVIGFGMTAERNDVHTFCWEWFTVERDDRATKLQETGELSIEIAEIGKVWEVVSTEFLTDISFRVARFGTDDPVRSPKWRVLIREGSKIRWPSVLDGKLVVN